MDAGEAQLDDHIQVTPVLRQEHKKAIRKYGKRTASERDAPRPRESKRRKTSPVRSPSSLLGSIADAPKVADKIVDKITDECRTKASNNLSLPAKPAATTTKKCSILSYFKPEPASSSAPPSDIPSSPGHDLSTPPSSPPPPPPPPGPRRAPRRLTTRPALAEESDTSLEVQARPPRSSPPLDTVTGTGTGTITGSSRKKAVGKNAVQTTLNLSIQGDLTECEICEMLYNSVHPKDVELHAKRHAAVLKQQKVQDNVDDDDQ